MNNHPHFDDEPKKPFGAPLVLTGPNIKLSPGPHSSPTYVRPLDEDELTKSTKSGDGQM